MADIEKLRAAVKRAKGDPLGLLTDPEASAAVVAVSHERAIREDTPEAWSQYEAVKAEHDQNHGPK